MAIILIGGTKGGTGKTTSVINLCCEALNDGKDVILVDCDRQASASNWIQVRDEAIKKDPTLKRIPSIQKYGIGVKNELLELNKRYEHVFIDAGGHDSVELRSALTVADILYVPVSPTQNDLWGLSALIQMITDVRPFNETLKTVIFPNLVDPNPSIKTLEIAIKALQDALGDDEGISISECSIKRRICYVHSIPKGRGASEMDNVNKKSIEELRKLYNEIFSYVKDDPKKNKILKKLQEV